MSNLTNNQHEDLLEIVTNYISENTSLEKESIFQIVDDQLTILESKLQKDFESKL